MKSSYSLGSCPNLVLKINIRHYETFRRILKTNIRHYDSFRRILTDLCQSTFRRTLTIVLRIFFRSLIGLLKFSSKFMLFHY